MSTKSKGKAWLNIGRKLSEGLRLKQELRLPASCNTNQSTRQCVAYPVQLVPLVVLVRPQITGMLRLTPGVILGTCFRFA